MAIDRLPSGSFRARLMIDGQRYSAAGPTEADARFWELGTRAAASRRRGAAPVTFAHYATGWLAGFIDDAPDRARFEAALKFGLLPVLGQLALVEVLESDRTKLHGQLPDIGRDGDDGTTRECLHLILEDAVEDVRAGTLAAWRRPSRFSPATTRLRE